MLNPAVQFSASFFINFYPEIAVKTFPITNRYSRKDQKAQLSNKGEAPICQMRKYIFHGQ